jgi:coenzyme F420-reducing hydrogenase delta subunit
MNAQMKGLLSTNGTKKPLILAFCCSECGHTAVDSSGMAKMKYPANVRIMKVPCTGILQVHQFFEALKTGAEGVMVVGCKSDGCHYEEGVQKAEKRVELAKTLLKEYGIEPERLQMFNMVYIEGDKFAEAARTMTKTLEAMGTLSLLNES